MPVELIEIVNPNGRKGLVASTSDAAKAYKTPPSTRNVAIPDGAPDDSWTVDQLRTYADLHQIPVADLGARPLKADLLAAVTATGDPKSSTSDTSNDKSQED